MGFLNGIDHSLFLFLNGFHNEFWDRIMFVATQGWVWLPVYLVFFYLVVRKYGWNVVFIVVFTALLILISDQLSNVAKDFFHRLRPSNEPGLAVHLVNAYKGGKYGFYSAHASNMFSLAVFLIILLKPYFRYFFIPVLFWALFLSYTRIYLGVHFPGDILAGIIVGCLIGWGMAKTCQWVMKKVSLNLRVKKS